MGQNPIIAKGKVLCPLILTKRWGFKLNIELELTN